MNKIKAQIQMNQAALARSAHSFKGVDFSSRSAFIESFKNAHPIGQNSSNGYWGFERVCDCLNLKRCVFKSQQTASRYRTEAAKNAASDCGL